MKTTVRFFKQNRKWYADIPNHTLEENEMVCGADELLDYICFHILKEITLEITTEQISNFLVHLIKKEQDEFGCTYKVDGNPFMQLSDEIWICNVTLDVFGEFPEHLYINIFV